MRVLLASVSPRGPRGKSAQAEALVADYTARLTGWLRVEARVFLTEQALLGARPARSRLVLLDEAGSAFTSRQFADWLGKQRESAVPELMLAVGPADGWSEAARGQADGLISLSRMTLPRELARVVAAEQLYRAWAILEGHPYHRA